MFSFSCLCSSSSSNMGCGMSKLEPEVVRSACETPSNQPNHHRGDHHHHDNSLQVHKNNKILPMQDMEMIIKRRSNSDQDDLKDKDHRWMEKKEVDQDKQSGHDPEPEVQKEEDQEIKGPRLFLREDSLFFPGSPSFREYCVHNIVVDDDCDSRDGFNFNKGNDVEGENKHNNSEMNNLHQQNKSQMNNFNVDEDHIKQNNVVKSETNIINIVDGEKKQNTSEIMEGRPRDHADKQPEGPQHEKKVGRVRRFRNAISRNRQARKSTLNVHNTNYSSSNNNNPQKLVGKAA